MPTGILGGTAGPPALLHLTVRRQGQGAHPTFGDERCEFTKLRAAPMVTSGSFLCWTPLPNTSHALSLTLHGIPILKYTRVETGPERFSGSPEVTQAFILLVSPLT